MTMPLSEHGLTQLSSCFNSLEVEIRAGNRLEFQYRLSLAQNRLINRLITGSN